MSIKIGIDLDNTIISYNNIINLLAKKKYKLNKEKNNKVLIKKEIIKKYGEVEWTKFQSLLYGENLKFAEVFYNFKKNISKIKNDYEIYIISHKTKYPYIGKKINLIYESKKFIKINKISYCKNEIIKKENIYFENTIENKIKRIKKLKINYFIDDLEGILNKLPNNINKIIFNNTSNKYYSLTNWDNLETILFKINYPLIYHILCKRFKIKNLKVCKNFEGTNNLSFIINHKNKFFLKIFKYNKRKSFDTEILFYKFYSKKFDTVAKLNYYNRKYRFIILNYISRTKNRFNPSKYLISSQKFIKKIQNFKIQKFFINKKTYAKDNLMSLAKLKTDLKIKIENLETNTDKNFKIKIKKVLIRIKKYLVKTKQSNYNFLKKHYILSPSDFTIKNSIFVNNKYYFFDFEYFGLDHPAKLLSDILSQPWVKFKKKDIESTIYFFKKYLNLKVNSHILNILINLAKIKWILIILKCYEKNISSNKINLYRLRKNNLKIANSIIKGIY
jgi:hypothetical protein